MRIIILEIEWINARWNLFIWAFIALGMTLNLPPALVVGGAFAVVVPLMGVFCWGMVVMGARIEVRLRRALLDEGRATAPAHVYERPTKTLMRKYGIPTIQGR